MKRQFFSPVHRNAAFSMTELLVAVVIFAVGVIPLLGYLTSGLKKVLAVGATNAALGLATEGIELVSNRPFEQLKSPQTFPLGVSHYLPDLFTRMVKITPVRGGSLAKIEVTVEWKGERGRNRSVRLVNLVAAQGGNMP